MKQSNLIIDRVSGPHYSGRITSVLIILFCFIASTQAQSLIPELSFKNPVLKTGKGSPGDGLDGAVYIFDNVGWGMDALVTILGRSSAAVSLSSTDIPGPEQNPVSGTGFDNAWQPGVKFGDGKADANQEWWMEFRISFVLHNDQQTLMPVNQFFVSGLDIDGDGNQLHEFQAFYKTQSYKLDQQTAIYASSVIGSDKDPLLNGKRFDGPVKNYSGISTDAEDAMVSIFYRGCSSLTVRLGARTGNSATTKADRMYGLLFKSLAFGVPVIPKETLNLVASNQNNNGK
jgi:hypothetical protein